MQVTQIFLEVVVLIALGSTQVKPVFQLGSKTQLTCWLNPSGQVTKVSWFLEPRLLSLAGFIKTNKKPGLSCWVGWFHIIELGSLAEFQNTQLTQVYLSLETQLTLPSLAGFIKTLKAGFSLADGFPEFVAAEATQQTQRLALLGFWNPAYPGWVH